MAQPNVRCGSQETVRFRPIADVAPEDARAEARHMQMADRDYWKAILILLPTGLISLLAMGLGTFAIGPREDQPEAAVRLRIDPGH